MNNEIKIKFPEKQLEKVIVEAGHIYTNDQPSLEHEISAKIGGTISQFLILAGCDVEKWLFIDDYNPLFEDKQIILDEKFYIEMLEGHEFKPDKVVYERELIEKAKDALDYLCSNNYAYHDAKTGKIKLMKGNIHLYDSVYGHNNCPLLDACLYIEKLKNADSVVTVLDVKYKAEQKNTFTILKKLGFASENIISIYYSTPEDNNAKNAKITPNLIQILKLFGDISKVTPIETSLELEAMKYAK